MAQTQIGLRGFAFPSPQSPFGYNGQYEGGRDTPMRERANAVSKTSAKQFRVVDAYIQNAIEGLEILDGKGMSECKPLVAASEEGKPYINNCYILKIPTELLLEIEELLPEGAKICLRHSSARLLQLKQFPGWASQEHLKAYQNLVSFDKAVTLEKEGERIPGLEEQYACSYCKDYHAEGRFSVQELLECLPRKRKCLGADATRTLRISSDVDLTWAEFTQYLGKEEHAIIKQSADIPNNLYTFKWSHIIYMYRTPEMESSLTARWGLGHDFSKRMLLTDNNVTISIRHDDAVIISRHIPLGLRTTLTADTLAYTLSDLGPDPICAHITIHDLLINDIKSHDEPCSFSNILSARPELYEVATGVQWSGMHKCTRCPMMFWFLDGMNRVNIPSDSVSLEIYRAFPGFTRKADWNLSDREVDEPGTGWVEYFTREIPGSGERAMLSEYGGIGEYRRGGSFGDDVA